uniref:CCHC-type domain-containing protein n=1 Tax=Tanacetum cinerariifolium TaxID=118510 RepID=A0A6L2JGC2_TANCI|nr:hypothetical protein [Tanacetum cinerariifolium]
MLRYVVPTGRVVVPTDRYVVPAGNVIIVSSGRLSLIPTGRVLTPGSKDLSRVGSNKCLKRTGRDHDGRVIILPPTTADEHIAVQRESKARTTLLQSIPDDHVADFHYMDDARDIWNAVKARFGGNAKSKNMRKSMLKQEFLEFKISEAEGLHKGYDRMQKILSLTLKTKGGLKLLSFNDLYHKLKTLEVDVKGYTTFSSSQSAGPSHFAFVSTTSASKKMSYGDSLSYSSTMTYTAPSNSKTSQQLAYEDFEQIEKLDLEEMDLKWQMDMLSVRVHKFEQKAGRKIDFDKKESDRFNNKKVRCYKCQQRGHFARECRAKGRNDKQRYSSFKIKEIGKNEEDLKALITVDTLVDWTYHDGESDGVIASKEFGMIAGCDIEDAIEKGAARIYNLIIGADTEEASTANDAGEFALMGVTFEVHNCPFGSDNKYNELHKQYNELNEQNGEYFIQVQAYKNSLKTLEKQKRVLQRNQLTLEDKIRVLSIELENTSNLLKHSERINADVKTAKKELQTKLDNHLVNTNDFASSDSSVKSSEPKPNDSTSRASTSSDLPSFSYNSSNMNENTFRTSCSKNVVLILLRIVIFMKQMVNKTVGIGVGPVHSKNKVNHSNQFVPQAVLLSTGKTYTPYVPTMYYNHMQYGRDRWTTVVKPSAENPFPDVKDKVVFDSGCSRSMTGNKERLDDFQAFQGRKVTFGGDEDTECLVLSKDFKLPDESMVVLRVPRKHNLYTINLNNLCPRGNLACLVAHASVDESVKWHKRMGNANYKNMNKLVKGNLVRGLPPKIFKNDHTCVTKAVRTACYVLNRVLVTSPHNKTPYALLTRNIPAVSHFKPFGCYVTILNISDHLVKFDGKADEYSASNKAYMVYNVPNKRVEETMNLRFLEEKPNVHGLGHEWYFDLDYLTDTLGYKHVQANQSVGTQKATTNPTGTAPKDTSSDEVDDSPLYSTDEIFQKELARLKGQELRATFDAEILGLGFANDAEELQKSASAKIVPPSSIPVPSGDTMVSTDDVPVDTSSLTDSFFDDKPTTRFPSPSDLRNHDPSPGIFSSSSYDDEFDAALNNVASTVEVSLVATKRINTIHPQSLNIGDHTSAVQTRSKMGFMVYLMDVKSAFLYGRIDKKVWCDEFEVLMKGEFQMSAMGELTFFLGLQVQQRPNGIFINQDKYVQEILCKFDLGSVRMANTPYEAPKPKSKNESDSPVNVHLYRSMIGSLMYLTALRPDIMFAVSACSRNQITPTTSNLKAVKKIFKYLKGQPKLGLWYPKESPLVLEAYSDSDYVGANKDRKSTTGGCQFLGRRLISWKCKKQTIGDTSSTEAEYVAATNCCGQPNGSRGWISDFQVLYMHQSTAMLRSPELGSPAIQATIDKTPYTITEDLVKSQLQLADDGGIDDLPIAKIYSRMDNLRYVTEGKLTFFKNKFSPQWRFLVHTILHCLSTKSGVAAQAVPQHMPTPDQPQDHLSTPPRQQTSDPNALVFEHNQISTPVHKVNPLETKLKDHKKLFKDVVGKLVKKVKAIEVKLQTTKRKMVVSDSDQKEGGRQDVDLDALLALANAAMTVDSNIPPGGASNNPAASTSVPADVPTSANDPTGSTSVSADVLPSVAPAGVSNKGKSPMVEEDVTVKEMTFKQMKEDILELQRRRQQEVLDSAMYYTKADWIYIMAQVEANASLFKTLLGDDVSKDNFPARMAALIKRKKQALAEKLAKERRNRPMTQG